MTYDLSRLVADVMMRLGENARPLSASPIPGIATPAAAITARVRSLLPQVGSRLIREASPGALSGGELLEFAPEVREMPCGSGAADITLPADAVRIVSVRVGEIMIPGGSLIAPDSGGWSRQYSAEAGIAGMPGRPVAYLMPDAVLRVVGVPASGSLSLSLWKIPVPDEEDRFRFPEALYWNLVGEL